MFGYEPLHRPGPRTFRGVAPIGGTPPPRGDRGVSWCPPPLAARRPRVVQPKLAHEWVDNAPPPPGGAVFFFCQPWGCGMPASQPPRSPKNTASWSLSWWGWCGCGGFRADADFGRCIDFDRVFVWETYLNDDWYVIVFMKVTISLLSMWRY